MKERDIHRIIEEHNPEEKQAMYQKLQSKLGIPDAPPKPAKRKMKKSWIVSIAVVCVCVLSLAVILPIVLPNGDEERFVDVSNGVAHILDCTLGEYSQQTNQSILHVNWYDIADETQTILYTNVDDESDIYYMFEYVVNGETGDRVDLYVTDTHTRVNGFDRFYENCQSEYTVNGVTVLWGGTWQESQAMFEYQGYRYYVEISEGERDDLVKEIIEEMLNQ